VLSALNWVLNNRSLYNIRVVNMSLGAPAVESYQDDPVCQAVRKLVNAGIVVVAAAGNNGKNTSGQKIYGSIHSPGDEPSAITVGASNTFGTDSRSDDGVATYSSRGPTRGYRTDSVGVKHYDNLIKPDLVAPGNKIVGAESPGNLLLTQHPDLDESVSSYNSRREMRLNGTSMAAPVVAGAAALLLQANPSLSPNMVKTILGYTAQPLANFNMLEQGAGELNIEGAVRLAKLVRTDLTSTTAVGTPLLTSAAPSPVTTIAGFTFNWSRGIVLNNTYATGLDLITKYQKIYANGVVLSDGVVLSNGVVLADATMLSGGVALGNNIMTSAGVIMGDGTVFCSQGVVLGDGVVISDGVVLGDGVVLSDGVVMSDGTLASDATTSAQSASNGGDLTSSMPIVIDSGVDNLSY
jgi:serine protease AprX